MKELFNSYWWLIVVLIVGIIIVALLGWAWAYLYEWGKCNVLLGFTTPVNYSVWEMSKIIIYPMLIFFVVLYACAYHVLRNPAVALLTSTVSAIAFVWLFFYLYTVGNMKNNNMGANIAIWILGIVAAMIVMFFVFTAPYLGDIANYTCLAVYLIIIFLFWIFTYTPPCKCGVWWYHKKMSCSRGEPPGPVGPVNPPTPNKPSNHGNDCKLPYSSSSSSIYNKSDCPSGSSSH